MLPEGLVRVGAVLLSWAFSPLGRSLPNSLPWNLLPSMAPFSLLGLKGLTTYSTRNLKVSLYSAWLFSPRKGRRPVWCFSPSVAHYLFEITLVTDYFFISGARSPYDNLVLPLCNQHNLS